MIRLFNGLDSGLRRNDETPSGLDSGAVAKTRRNDKNLEQT